MITRKAINAKTDVKICHGFTAAVLTCNDFTGNLTKGKGFTCILPIRKDLIDPPCEI